MSSLCQLRKEAAGGYANAPVAACQENQISAQARVCAHSLWSPYTLYYSFPDITCGLLAIFSESREANILERCRAARRGTSVSTSAHSKGITNPCGQAEPQQRNGWDVK